eukprot:2914995-Rhodomonas_salina.2
MDGVLGIVGARRPDGESPDDNGNKKNDKIAASLSLDKKATDRDRALGTLDHATRLEIQTL